MAVKSCKICGKEIISSGKPGHPAEFCSEEHRLEYLRAYRRAHAGRIEKRFVKQSRCLNCGKILKSAPNARGRRKKYCNQDCYKQYLFKKYKTAIPIQNQSDDWITVAEAAKISHKSRWWIYSEIRAHRIHAERRYNRIVVSVSSLQQWMGKVA